MSNMNVNAQTPQPNWNSMQEKATEMGFGETLNNTVAAQPGWASKWPFSASLTFYAAGYVAFKSVEKILKTIAPGLGAVGGGTLGAAFGPLGIAAGAAMGGLVGATVGFILKGIDPITHRMGERIQREVKNQMIDAGVKYVMGTNENDSSIKAFLAEFVAAGAKIAADNPTETAAGAMNFATGGAVNFVAQFFPIQTANSGMEETMQMGAYQTVKDAVTYTATLTATFAQKHPNEFWDGMFEHIGNIGFVQNFSAKVGWIPGSGMATSIAKWTLRGLVDLFIIDSFASKEISIVADAEAAYQGGRWTADWLQETTGMPKIMAQLSGGAAGIFLWRATIGAIKCSFMGDFSSLASIAKVGAFILGPVAAYYFGPVLIDKARKQFTAITELTQAGLWAINQNELDKMEQDLMAQLNKVDTSILDKQLINKYGVPQNRKDIEAGLKYIQEHRVLINEVVKAEKELMKLTAEAEMAHAEGNTQLANEKYDKIKGEQGAVKVFEDAKLRVLKHEKTVANKPLSVQLKAAQWNADFMLARQTALVEHQAFLAQKHEEISNEIVTYKNILKYGELPEGCKDKGAVEIYILILERQIDAIGKASHEINKHHARIDKEIEVSKGHFKEIQSAHRIETEQKVFECIAKIMDIPENIRGKDLAKKTLELQALRAQDHIDDKTLTDLNQQMQAIAKQRIDARIAQNKATGLAKKTTEINSNLISAKDPMEDILALFTVENIAPLGYDKNVRQHTDETETADTLSVHVNQSLVAKGSTIFTNKASVIQKQLEDAVNITESTGQPELTNNVAIGANRISRATSFSTFKVDQKILKAIQEKRIVFDSIGNKKTAGWSAEDILNEIYTAQLRNNPESIKNFTQALEKVIYNGKLLVGQNLQTDDSTKELYFVQNNQNFFLEKNEEPTIHLSIAPKFQPKDGGNILNWIMPNAEDLVAPTIKCSLSQHYTIAGHQSGKEGTRRDFEAKEKSTFSVVGIFDFDFDGKDEVHTYVSKFDVIVQVNDTLIAKD
jgi:hypothetical protein